ncbi:efflux transporter outer membrane subunit [Oleiagrimonas sp. C23AA]|uniref:efflux transporter outer membrane subunit n=1 Tax=Oleiagrimonas sp. C23AA TaxID=2719047 RepID=UPI0014200B30|nr:efflux transporter outer membrane subunit [Oleiagrimonas sp. C23AA]NII11693.1 efflux transporter outer membrane subunit [Oleiagrimonas sp. C23AA]
MSSKPNLPGAPARGLARRLAVPALALGASLALAACAPPTRPPDVHLRDSAPLAGIGASQPGWPDARWWQQFGDAQLDALMQRAMRESPSMTLAKTRYRQARAAIARQRAKLSPEVRGRLQASHSYANPDIDVNSGSAQGQGQSQSLINLPDSSTQSNVGVVGAMFTWDLDLWGRTQAALDSAIDSAHAAEASRAMAAASLQYNVANAYFAWQAVQARLQVARHTLARAQRYVKIEQLRVGAGVDDPDQLDQARSQRAQARQQQAQLDGMARIRRAQLAALIGISSADLGKLKPMPLPHPDAHLPSDARIGLLARRPDIVAARWQVEAAARGVDEAHAAYYPDVSLTGLGAYLRMYPKLGSGDHVGLTLGSFGPAVSLPIFEGGRLDAAYNASRAKLNQAIAKYNQTVAEAAGKVARQVLTMRQLVDVSAQQRDQEAAAARSYKRAQLRVERGVDDPRQALSAGMKLDSQRDQMLQLRAQRLSTQLALIHELGGGYTAPRSLPGNRPAHAQNQEASR